MASSSEPGRPHIDEVGPWPAASANSFRQQYLGPARSTTQSAAHDSTAYPNTGVTGEGDGPGITKTSGAADTQTRKSSDDKTAVPSPAPSQPEPIASATEYPVVQSHDNASEKDEKADGLGGFETIKPATTNASSIQPKHPGMKSQGSAGLTEDELFRVISSKRTNTSGRKTSLMTRGQSVEADEEQAEVEKLMSRMFGRARQQNSEEEKTRHVGLVFKDLTVKGVGMGAALQGTLGDPFLALPRLIKGLITGGASKLSGKPPVRTILNSFTGCIRPGEMLLVLGQPGSGCSSFLKVLANQRSGFESVDGEVTYGGTDQKTMAKHYRGEILYNPEDDLHYPTLTVKNTLEFALKTRTPSKASRNEGESRVQYVQEFLRVVTKLFWIEHTLGTKVGDEFVRGVSGGEKKRVSIAEAMITKASTQLWDNSTRGLDASTALEYVQSLRSLTNMAHISTGIALYQAGESLYDLFDKVVLIDEGRCLYYGSTEEAAAYFEGLGFTRPPRWTTADFLTSVTEPHARKVKAGYEDRIPRSAEQFEAAYRKSQTFDDNLHDIEGLERESESKRKERLELSTKATKEKNYTIPFHKQVWACTHRQVLIMFGDRLTLGGKWGGILFQALIVGSVFVNMPKTSAGVFTRGGVMFFMLLFNALLALAELTSAFSSRPILLKHKSFSFYRPAAYAIAQTVVDMPLVLIQVLIFDIVVYWMSGLGKTASQFFINLLFLWITTMVMYSFFRSLGALCKSLDVATRLTGVAIQVIIVYTGYLIPPQKMHPWFKWLIWINPLQYSFEALMSNEFYSLDLQCVPPNVVPQGPFTSPQYQSCTLQGSQPGQLTVNGADYILTAFTYTRAHLWRNFGIITGFWLFFVGLTMLGMELQKPNAGGGSVTIFKRGQAPKSVTRAIEDGNSPEDEERAAAASDGPVLSDSDSEGVVKGVAKNESIFTYTNVNYTIPVQKEERKLLSDVQGYVRPGKLTALMGASGAGKTTLLNTLAQRINFGVVRGDFLVDGRPLPKSFQRATGFAEQMDVHEPASTIREALRFSALLRQPKEVPTQEKYEYCEKIIDLLEMRDIAGATIGSMGVGLNQEQRKRVTIAVELASKPELLMFLDEPTSGLDSGAAFNIIRFLRKLADNGQALLVTIHQPSSVLFEQFDELILLKSGGRVVYHGELGKDSRLLIDYFERNGAPKCPPRANPAEYMLEAIGAGNPDYSGQDWGDVWADSPEHGQRTQEIQSMISSRRAAPKNLQIDDDREYAMPLVTQISSVLNRCFVHYWRTPDYIMGKFILHIVTGLFNTFTFYHVGSSQIDMQSRVFSIFMTLTIAPPLIQQLQPKFLEFRNLYEGREANSKIYAWPALVIGSALVELPYSLVAGTIYFFCWWYGAVGRGATNFESAYTWMLLMLFEMFFIGFGQAIASVSPNEILASILVPMFFLFVVSFCGVVIPFAAIPYVSRVPTNLYNGTTSADDISQFWQSWMYHLTPFTYLLEGFLGVAVHNRPVICETNEYARFAPPPGQTCQSYTEAFIAQAGGYVQNGSNGLCEFCQYANGDEFARGFNVYYDHKWMDYGVFWAYCVFNFMVVFFGSWLYLGGLKSIRRRFSAEGRKQRKAKAVGNEKA